MGAVSPLLAPSWLTARAPDHGEHRVAVAAGVGSRSSSSTPAPSAQPVPSAASAKDLQRPSAARPRCRLNSTKVSGVAITVDAAGQREVALALAQRLAARCRATSDEEQAVSTVTAGPSRPKV